jgi:hypothetical protein
MTVFVLWENHATGPIDRFGPHGFLLACVANRLSIDRFELKRSRAVMGRSCSGNGGVLRELGRRPLWDTAPHLIAVLDSDKLHDLVGGDARSQVARAAYPTWSAQMETRCRQRLGPHDEGKLTFRFLDRNLESLLEVLGDDAGRKDVLQRDKILQRASSDAALIERASGVMSSWSALVETVVQRLVRR